MAVEWASKTMQRSGDIYGEYPENIVIIPELNGRHENTEIESLIADMEAIGPEGKRVGQHTPCGFRKGENNETILVFGHRRYRAVMEINKRREKTGTDPVKLLGTYMRISEKDAFIRAISENRERKDVSAIDDAYNIGLLIERFQRSLEEIAVVYFPNAKTDEAKAEALRFVKQRHALLESAPEAAQAVRDGRIKITAALHLAKWSRADQKAEIAAKPTGRIKGKDIAPAKKSAEKPETKADQETPNLKGIIKKMIADVPQKDLENEANEDIAVNRVALVNLIEAIGL